MQLSKAVPSTLLANCIIQEAEVALERKLARGSFGEVKKGLASSGLLPLACCCHLPAAATGVHVTCAASVVLDTVVLPQMLLAGHCMLRGPFPSLLQVWQGTWCTLEVAVKTLPLEELKDGEELPPDMQKASGFALHLRSFIAGLGRATATWQPNCVCRRCRPQAPCLLHAVADYTTCFSRHN